MRRFKVLIVIVAIMLTFASNSAVKAASWEKCFILDKNSLDIKLMSDEDDPWSDSDIRDDLVKEFKVSSDEIEYDYSSAFVQWEILHNYNVPFDEWYPEWRDSQSSGAWQENYDGMPYYLNSERHIMLPVIIGGERKAIVEVYNSRPGLDEFPQPSDGLLGGGPTVLYSDWLCGFFTSSLDEYYIFAEEAYNAVTAQGATVKKIIYTCGWPDESMYMGISSIYAVTVEDECKGYMYNVKTDQLFTFDEFHTILMNGSWPFSVEIMPTATRTPFWTPRPSSTSSISAPNTQTIATPTLSKTATATPSAGETATPALTAAASLFPSSSSAPEQNTGSAVLIVIVGVLVIAAAGAAGWAVFRKKKGKE